VTKRAVPTFYQPLKKTLTLPPVAMRNVGLDAIVAVVGVKVAHRNIQEEEEGGPPR